jgi:antirestriction protein ArdC
VVFWRVYVYGVEVKAGETEAQETEGQGKRRLVLRYYSVFNTEQCELPTSLTEKLAVPEQRQLDPLEACGKILADMPNPPEIVHGGDKAFYSPLTHQVSMPPRRVFVRPFFTPERSEQRDELHAGDRWANGRMAHFSGAITR